MPGPSYRLKVKFIAAQTSLRAFSVFFYVHAFVAMHLLVT